MANKYLAVMHAKHVAWTAEFEASSDELAFRFIESEAEYYNMQRVELFRKGEGHDVNIGRILTKPKAVSYDTSGTPI